MFHVIDGVMWEVDTRLVGLDRSGVLRPISVVALLGASVWPSGEAQAVPHRLCLYFDIGDQFWDASPRAADGEDFSEEYGRNVGPLGFPAQRRLARIRDEGTGEIVWGWRPLGGWAPFPADPDPACNCGSQPDPPDPADAGCADFDLEDPETTLTVEWTRWSVWGDPLDPSAPATGNQIIGYDCDETMTVCDFNIPFLAGVPAGPGGETTLVVPFVDLLPVDLPLWAMTFAEDRFASLGEQPLEDTRIYLGYDQADVLPGATQSDRTFGNQPSVILKGDSFHSKFTASHEYGHQQTINAHHMAFGPPDLNYCHDPATYPMVSNDCSPNHLLFSQEWQGAAAIEGIAHWYAASTWHDVDDAECLPGCSVRTNYIGVTDEMTAVAYDIPRSSPVCPVVVGEPCPAGVSNEHDWVSALREFRLGTAGGVGFQAMLTMLEAYYGTGGWVAADPSDAFWTSFDQGMMSHLGGDYGAWSAAAQQWRLDR